MTQMPDLKMPFLKMPFLKMHGLGNDFIVLDARANGPMGDFTLDETVARLLADRQMGIGCDQIMILRDAKEGGDVYLDMRNQDGSHTGACGNGTRCVASLIMAETDKNDVIIETMAGHLTARLIDDLIEVDMGPAMLGWQDVPLSHEMDTLDVDLSPLEDITAVCLSMGNPHAVLFVEDADKVDVARRGAALERFAIFPQAANISFAHVISDNKIRMRVFERGVGITRACGSGACAVAVAACRRGLTQRHVEVVLDGGSLFIEWQEDTGSHNGHVLMRGPASLSYEGVLSGDLAEAFAKAQSERSSGA
ncbi:MAG: diaminopimelate epimerase [Candidatus Puniceispirillaceae bacterium]